MTGVELILTALGLGGAAAVSTVANSAVGDAYAGLKRSLAARLARHGTDPGPLLASAGTAGAGAGMSHAGTGDPLGAALAACGADADSEIVDAARRLVRLAYAELAAGGQVRVGTNFGAIGTFHGPVTITPPPGGTPDPPAYPGPA